METVAPRLNPASARPGVTAAVMAETGLDEVVLRQLMHRFYGNARADKMLGPIFSARVSDWTPHLERNHVRDREQLPMLASMAERVEDVHFGEDSVPDGLSILLQKMIGEMEAHMKKEELILFPAIRRSGMPGIEQPIAAMRADHAGHDREVAEIRRLTLPEGACGTWTRLYDGLAEFIEDLTEHMRLENEVLFLQFELAGRADA